MTAREDQTAPMDQTERPSSVSPQLLEALLASVQGMAYRSAARPDRTLEFASELAEAVTGRTPAELTSGRLRWSELQDPAELAESWEAIQRAIAERRPFRVEYRLRFPDGSQRWVSEFGQARYDDAGRALSLEGVVTDATARRSGDRAGALLAAIVDSSDDAIISKDLGGIITSWNPAAERMFGYTALEAIGRSITMLIPADRQDEEPRILARIQLGERVDHFETVRVRKDGRLVDISVTISPVKDAAGRVIGASKVAREVSERKRAEAQLRQQQAVIDELYNVGLSLSAEDLEKLLRHMTDAATSLAGARFGAFFYNALDPNGGHYLLYTLSGASRDDFERFGMPRNTPIFAPTFAGLGVVRLDDVTRDPRYGKNPPHRGMPAGHLPVKSYLAVPVVGRKGKVFGGLFLGHPEPGVFGEEAERVVSGLAVQAAVAIENAQLYETEQRLRREAEAAGRAKDEFLAMLGHELRNPLSSVRNAVLAASLDPAYAQQAFGIVRRGAEQLTRLVDDLLDVARITQGKITLERERVSLVGVVERALETARPVLEERAHHLTLALPPGPVDVQGDQTRLEQIVVNLLANAAKFTEPGGRIRVAVEREGASALLSVEDSGVGIAEELLPRIFDLFAQAEAGLARSSGGLGIGLTIVKRLAELHGGTVEARSRGPGTGAEFIVRLPLLARREAPQPPPARAAGAARARSARILVVEDNLDAADSLAMLLELLGHEVEVVHDGAAGIERARSYRPELMFVDIGLPGIDGYEVARRIRAEAIAPGVVLVALTGYGGPEYRERALEAGFDHHYAKPVDAPVLRALTESLAR
jgi:PAS domain S-box-containing protein